MYFIGSNVMNFPLQAQRAVVDGELTEFLYTHWNELNFFQATRFVLVSDFPSATCLASEIDDKTSNLDTWSHKYSKNYDKVLL